MKVIGVRKRCEDLEGNKFLSTSIIYIKETNPYFSFYKTSPVYKVVSEVDEK